MSNALRISEAASLALHTMVLLAASGGRRRPAREIAERLGASEAHLSKVLQRLRKVGLADSVRGPQGGFTLAKLAGEISLLDVYEAIEGPLGEARCLLGEPICRGEGCILGGLITSVNRQVREYLAGTTLGQLTGAFGPDSPKKW